MKRKLLIRIGSGEYERVGDKSTGHPLKLWYFFKLILESQQDVADSLYAEPYEHYRPIGDEMNRVGRPWPLWWEVVYKSREREELPEQTKLFFKSLEKEFNLLSKSLIDWGKRWNLYEPWYMQEALEALEARYTVNYYRKHWESFEGESAAWVLEEGESVLKSILVDRDLDRYVDWDDIDDSRKRPPGSFPWSEKNKKMYPYLEPPGQLPIWFPPVQFRKTYLRDVRVLAKQCSHHVIDHILPTLKRNIEQIFPVPIAEATIITTIDEMMVKDAEAAAEQYCNEVEKLYESLKEWKKSPYRPMLKSHMLWTARVRTHGCSPSETARIFEQIAAEEGLETVAIKKAVRQMLRELWLPLKPTFNSSKGRPAGRKDSPKTPRQLYRAC